MFPRTTLFSNIKFSYLKLASFLISRGYCSFLWSSVGATEGAAGNFCFDLTIFGCAEKLYCSAIFKRLKLYFDGYDIVYENIMIMFIV